MSALNFGSFCNLLIIQPIITVQSYSSFLNDKFRELRIRKYQRKMENIFDILMEKGNPKPAIQYAKRMIKDGQGKTTTEIAPGTKGYELVEELAKHLPEEVKNCFEG